MFLKSGTSSMRGPLFSFAALCSGWSATKVEPSRSDRFHTPGCTVFTVTSQSRPSQPKSGSLPGGTVNESASSR
jgi:hypothetical protein